jgi:ribonuclease P protein component
MADRRNTFPTSHRLSGRKAFAAVYANRLRKNVGPVTFVGLANGLDHLRLGLSVSRKVGSAVMRNRIKRLLREAYRLQRHDLPGGYDVVLVVRPHQPMALDDYRRLVRDGVVLIARGGARRERRNDAVSPGNASNA